ncbi:MAG: ABC transporter permease [Corynebacterium sp.]|uniref:methionine ABC transporter permease n=1 Tax=Corynebacterium TaxID=1716 RepID=UPI002648D090|nr:methionine ABC transporter permease [Corynebacterium sp.]MDN5722723.1 ABC transporter permease [Corynebacterium sp.]MDN6283452.1 ABC transporter permease [Corynebacterium sp.]MDN6305240.1 ABC transporter permease [Corynebacterium sp.]MDN6353064.1 ABC transporter permease [Corynebacterium sp.]MDN6367448.1 ABC transporter permease [Corynebacterium sp.]
MSATTTATDTLLLAKDTNWEFLSPIYQDAIGQTLYMAIWGLALGWLVGLVLGVLLYTTRGGGVLANRPVFWVINLLVNIVRPIPFIILLTALGPLTKIVTGSILGINAATFAIIIAASFGAARIVEQNLVAIDPGVIEAARSMGASPLRIIFTVIIPEALGPLILGATFMFIAIIDMSAMAGYIGAGGLGDFAIQYGYRAYDNNVIYVALVTIIIIVQAAQLFGNWLAKKVMRR